MSSSRNMMKSLFQTGMLFSVLLVAPSLLLGADQFWNPTTTKQGAGSGVWATDAGAWANTSAGTNIPLPWVNGNSAFLTLNSGVNTGTVNGVTANRLNISQGTYVFNPGTGPLTISGSLTNTGGTVTFNADVVMSSDQNWDVRALTKINGTLTGPYTLKKTGAVSPALVISNANNNIAGIFIDSGNVNAYMGGNALGGSGSTITMGSLEQGLVAKLSINPLLTQPETTWAAGPIIANGYGEVSFVSDGTKTNIVNFGALGRSNRGVIGLRQAAGNMDV